MNSKQIKGSVDYMYRLAHTSDGWIVPLLDAVDGISPELALYSPGQGVATIWEIVVHATGWLEDTLRDLSGSPGPENIDWPQVERTDAVAWEATRHRLHSAATTLHELVTRLREDELFSPPAGQKTPRIRRIINMSIHGAYHAGQIVKLKQLYRSCQMPEREPAAF